MHVIANGFEIPAAAAIHDQSLVTTAEQVAKQLVPAIEPARVGSQDHFMPAIRLGWGVSITK